MAAHPIHSELIYLKVAEFLREGRKFALAVVMKDSGSTPRKAGTKAIIDEEGSIWGTIGGGILESDARKMGVEAIQSGKAKVFDFKFSGNCAKEDEPVCGGNMRVLIDPTASEFREDYEKIAEALQQRRHGAVLRSIHKTGIIPILFIDREWVRLGEGIDARINHAANGEGAQYWIDERGENLAEPIIPAPLLLIGGGGHVGQALARQAQLVGFEVVVIEDREEFADPTLFPHGVKCRRAPFKEALFEFPIDQDTYISLVGRGHKVDSKALVACIHSPAAYIGMMGSRRKVALVKKQFIESRIVDEEGWKKVHAPIGLDIGAEAVPEIAASIVAQMVAVRRQGRARRFE